MTTPFEAVNARLGISSQPKTSLQNRGFNFAPTIMGQSQQTPGQQTPGQQVLAKIQNRVGSGDSIYNNYKQNNMNKLATDVAQKSAGLKTDEFGRPNIQLGNFRDIISPGNQATQQRGQSALDTALAKNQYQNAVSLQNLGQYAFTGQMTVSGAEIPGASANNVGAQAAAMAMKVAANHTAYVWGGNSLTNGVDCSGLVQQIYRQLGISVPRVTYDQAKNGRQVSVNDIRPGDLVFYRPGPQGPEHVGIYVGNGHVVHAANPKLGVITSNLYNSNGSPLLVLRPY